MNVVADTSIWVDYLRRGTKGPAKELDSLLEANAVVVCGPVLGELLAGTPAAQRDRLWSAMSALPWADLQREDWRTVGQIAAILRAKGKSLPLTDIMIAVACVGASASLWSNDADFERISSVLPALELFQPRS